MVKRAHHRSAVRHVLAGTIGTLGALAVSTQVASANHVIVKAGDTVWKIAQEHHATVSAIENANVNAIKKVSDSVDLIYAGQQLTLPGNDTTMQADENGRYTVKPGDTLSKIAQNFHVSVATLMAWNGLTSNQLYIGQQLIVNGQGVTVTPATSVVNTQASITGASVANVAPEADQNAAMGVTANQAPVQSASADQQMAGDPTSVASSNATDGLNDGSAVSTTPTNASAATQMTAAATTNSGVDNSNVVSQANTASTTWSASTVESDAAAFATSDATVTSTPSTTGSAVTSTAVSTGPVSTATITPVSTAPVSTASATTPVSAVTSTATASVAPAPTTPASANTSVSAAPQPVASQAVTSASQAPASQATSQAPAQSQAAATTPAQPQSSASQDLHSGSVVSLAVKIANTNSVPYVWGGSSLSGMDCSGLVDYVYANAEGKQLPHNTVALESCVSQHSVSEAQPGDILFWGQHGATYHCAIYTGNNQFVAAAKPGTNVASYTISPYFEPSFAGTVK